MDDRLKRQMEFALEIDKEKNVFRQTHLSGNGRYHHDDKAAVDSPMDELLKDADVIDHCFKDASKPVKEKEQKRYDALCKELGL